MIEFWLLNAKLVGDGGEYRVRYTIDQEDTPKFIDKWEPIWISRWKDGKHTIKLELTDKDGNLVDNGGYNATTPRVQYYLLNTGETYNATRNNLLV